MSLPSLTPEERSAALEKAARARKERAEVKDRLKHGQATLPDVLEQSATDDVIGKMTQQQRDAILQKMPKTASRTR